MFSEVKSALAARRWLRRSSMLRLSLLLSAMFALGFVGALFVALSVGEDAIEQRVDETMVALAEANQLRQSARDSEALILRPVTALDGVPEPMRRAASTQGATVYLRDEYHDSDIWRVLIAADARDRPVFVAMPLEDSIETQEVLAEVLWITAVLVVLATLGVGLSAGLLAQRRMARIQATLARLAGGELTARTGLTRSRDDVDDIARQLDQTAAALERLVSQTRHLSASIAHDLRTPLARLRAQLERLPEGEQRGAALEEANALSAIFDTIMRIARIEAGQGQQGFEPIALGGLAEDLVETFGPVVEDAGKALRIDLNHPGQIQADRGMLVQALANLIQNALIHGGDQITLFAHGSTIGVADDGPGVDPDQFQEIIKPMVRLDKARRSQGTGLGLALVKAVADRHGADLHLARHEPQGLRAALEFTKL